MTRRRCSRLSESLQSIRVELAKIIVGQEDVIEQLLIALLAGGHCLLVGVPGLAKTLMISSLAKSIALDFQRIQFTPDLMPADITGTEVIQEDRSSGQREFRFIPGPIFANVILADEINRTPPKTQAALLEAMQEKQVTAGGRRHSLPTPFFVLATQNPIDQEGTYPLPEAQLDRFMFNVLVDYPSQADELEVVLRTTSDEQAVLETQISGENLLELAHVVRRIAITPAMALVATQIARLTRPADAQASERVRRCVRWGAGPRASQYMVLGCQGPRRTAWQPRRAPRGYCCRGTTRAAASHEAQFSSRSRRDHGRADHRKRSFITSIALSRTASSREQIAKVLRS